MAAHVLTKCT
uniref:Uncharacterized protein n=1 Tax=Arundo donax TaxID=35708 RepID=A0A0A8Z8G0_ARUDO